ncbi:hypothetical protein HDE_13267 [Halotydeus destructor]|nr:hypothetical protein HDE_13267 [Halotydeus destructor]
MSSDCLANHGTLLFYFNQNMASPALIAILFLSSLAEGGLLIGKWAKYGELEYMGIASGDGITKSEAVHACQEYNATLAEPRTRGVAIFLDRYFPYTLINVYYGTTETSKWPTWRWGSDGKPVERVIWHKGEHKCGRHCSGCGVNMWPQGWANWPHNQVYGMITCQRPVSGVESLEFDPERSN